MTKQKLISSDIIARNITKLAISDKTIDERIYSIISKKELEVFKRKSEKFLIYGALILFSSSMIFLILAGYHDALYYVGLALLTSILLLPTIFGLMKKILDRKVFIKKVGQKSQIKHVLEQSKEEFPDIYDLVENSFEIANQDGSADNFIAMLYTGYLSEMLIENDNLIMKENIKRVAFSIAHGTFILESLDLETLTDNELYLTSLFDVLDALEYIIENQTIDENELNFFKIKFPEIKKSISNMKLIIHKIKQLKDDKTLAKSLDKQTQKLRKIVEKEPIPNTKIKEIKSPSGMKRDQTLTAISAIDEEIIEIRTRAGNYYISKKYFDHEVLHERRMFELLTDKELEIKIEVLNATLRILEQNKDSLTEKEFEEIKSDHLSQLFATEQLLAKRKGKGKKVICPYCQTINNSIRRKCKKCGKELPYCIVCLNSLGKGTEVSICPHCSSFAHVHHFRDWLEKTSICPYCKKKIRKVLETTILESLAKVESKTK